MKEFKTHFCPMFTSAVLCNSCCFKLPFAKIDYPTLLLNCLVLNGTKASIKGKYSESVNEDYLTI